MNSNEPITVTRDVEGTVIPTGTKVTLQKGEQAFITTGKPIAFAAALAERSSCTTTSFGAAMP